MKDLPEKILKYALGIVFATLGFLITQGYARINENLIMLNKDMVELRVQVTAIQNQIIDEARVKEIVETELLKHRHKMI